MLYIKSSNPSEGYIYGPVNRAIIASDLYLSMINESSIGPDIGLVPNRRKLIIDTNYYIRFMLASVDLTA